MAATEGSDVAALTSAGLFGVGFTVAFALVVLWSQQVFPERPTAGFTVALVFIATGFIVGPSLFAATDAAAGRTAALVASALPTLLVAGLVAAGSRTADASDRRGP